MRQKIVAILGAVVTLGLFVLTNAKRLADAISIIHLPHDVGEFLTSMSQTPILISYGALAIGPGCLTYLAFSHRWPKGRSSETDPPEIAEPTPTLDRPPSDRSFPFGLFISNIWIQRPYLAERSVIHINLDGFNGTGEDIFLKSIEGQITLRTESLKPVGKLSRPTFVGVSNTRIDAFSEFSFTLEQDVPKRFAAELMGEEKLDRNFVFDGLDIVVQAVNDRLKIARLPLWDGAALVRNGENIRADRMIFLRAPQTPEIIELRSDAARLVDAASTFVEFKGRIQECIDRIDGSNHPVWLDLDARNARTRFLHYARVARAMREDHSPSFGGDMETRGEVLGALMEAKLTLDRILSNYH